MNAFRPFDYRDDPFSLLALVLFGWRHRVGNEEKWHRKLAERPELVHSMWQLVDF